MLWRPALIPARRGSQVMTKVTTALSIASFLVTAAVFATLLAIGEPVGYAFVVFFVIFVSVVPVSLP